MVSQSRSVKSGNISETLQDKSIDANPSTALWGSTD